VTIGRVRVEPRDFIVADETGIVVVPRARIGDTLDLCARIAAQESQLETQVRNDAVASWDAV
jgi:regulator of RNase E activity RraA